MNGKTVYITRDGSFYRSLVRLAIPVALQNLITFAVTFADNLMVGALGDSAISGVYMGSQIQTLLQLFSGGIEGAILILSAQYWGKGDRGSIKKIVSIGVHFSLIFGGILLWNADHDNLLWVAVCVAAMMGAFLVPYTRAKGEIFGLDMRLGIMSRLERYIVLVVCLLIGFPNIAMAVIAVFANITAIQRLLHMKKTLHFSVIAKAQGFFYCAAPPFGQLVHLRQRRTQAVEALQNLFLP